MARGRVPGVRDMVGRTLHAFEPLAPDWFVRVVAPKRAPVPWANMVRFALSVTVPLLVGVLLGHGAIGGFAGMGALLGAFGDAGGPFSRRIRRTGLGLVAGLIGLLAGRLVLTQGWIAVPVVGIFGLASGVMSSISAPFSFAGLQLLVYLAISSGPARVVQPPVLVGVFLLGAAWSILLSFLQTLIVREPDRPPLAVAAVLDELAGLLRLVGSTEAAASGGGAEPAAEEVGKARRRLTIAVGRAYDVITDARAHSPGGREDLRRLAAVLSAVTRLAAVALREARTRPDEAAAVVPDIEALRDRIASGRRSPSVPEPRDAPGNATRSALADAVRQLDTAGNEGSARLEPARRRPLETLAERLAGRKTWLFGARLAITMMVAEVVSLLVPLSRPYWLLLTTAVVLKPDYGSVFARGVQRTLGTLVGVLLGAAVLELVPQGPLLLVPVAVFAFLFPFGASRNFGMLSTFLTPLTLILVEFGGAGTAGAALARLVDTVLGAAVVLVVGYLPWPSTWRPRLGHGVADGADALADYALVAIGNPPRVVAPARRRAFGALSDARSDLQSALAEPTPQARAASAWFPLVSQLEQTADDLRDVSMLEGRVAEHGPEPAVSEVVDGLHDLAEAIRQQRPPRELPLPATGMLQRVGADVEGARRIVTGGGED